jgi:DNA-binding response OmpR family regulator
VARIVIIEDEERIASFLAKGLRAEGHQTQVCGDGRTGLDAALGHDANTPPARRPPEDVLQAGGVCLDRRTRRTRRARVGDQEVELSAREFSLADIFLTNPGCVLSREQLLDRVWGFDFDPGSNVVDVYVGYLRKKLGAAAISTVRGAGYRFNP